MFDRIVKKDGRFSLHRSVADNLARTLLFVEIDGYDVCIGMAETSQSGWVVSIRAPEDSEQVNYVLPDRPTGRYQAEDLLWEKREAAAGAL